ncbi:MAG: hypothetical protein ABSE64_08145 [Vulcanimicrobiaceae bacterium]|jgi:hypothetical protein
MFEHDGSIGIAAFALGQLLQKDSSVEAGVRAVLHVATLRRQTWWQAWSYLQLTNIYEPFEPDALEDAHRLMQRAFPDAARRNDILENAFAHYKSTRSIDANPGTYMLADIGDLESDLPIYEAALRKKINIERFQQRDIRRSILNRVKNQVQIYLMAVESGATIPMLGGDDPVTD